MKNRRKLIVMLGVVVIPADSVFRKQPFTREHAICLIFLPPLAHSDPLSVAITRLGALNGVKRDETSCTHLALLQMTSNRSSGLSRASETEERRSQPSAGSLEDSHFSRARFPRVLATHAPGQEETLGGIASND